MRPRFKTACSLEESWYVCNASNNADSHGYSFSTVNQDLPELFGNSCIKGVFPLGMGNEEGYFLTALWKSPLA